MTHGSHPPLQLPESIDLLPSWIAPASFGDATLPADAHVVKIDRKTWVRRKYVQLLAPGDEDAGTSECWGSCAMGALTLSYGITPRDITESKADAALDRLRANGAQIPKILDWLWRVGEDDNKFWNLRQNIMQVNDTPLFALPRLLAFLQDQEVTWDLLAQAKEAVLTRLFTHMGVRLEFEGEVELETLPDNHALSKH